MLLSLKIDGHGSKEILKINLSLMGTYDIPKINTTVMKGFITV